MLSGEAEAEVDGERRQLGPGGLALIPAPAPHDVRTVGAGPRRGAGFFAGPALVHRFSEPFVPGAEITVVGHGPRGEEVLTTSAASRRSVQRARPSGRAEQARAIRCACWAPSSRRS